VPSSLRKDAVGRSLKGVKKTAKQPSRQQNEALRKMKNTQKKLNQQIHHRKTCSLQENTSLLSCYVMIYLMVNKE